MAKQTTELVIFINLLRLISFANSSSVEIEEINLSAINLIRNNSNHKSIVVFNESNTSERDELNQTFSNSLNNEIPIRFDGDQLFRLNNVKEDNLREIINFLENNYHINLWKENAPDFVDFSVPKLSLDDVKTYLENRNFTYNILLHNLQEAINNETITDYRIKRSTNQLSGDGVGFMSWNEYHGLKDVYGMLKHFNKTKPKLCKLYNIGLSNENRSLLVMRISNNNQNNKAIWIDGGIHAREWISPAAVTYIIYHFIENWNSLPSHIRNINWYFMPMVNPDGYEYSRKFNRLWRKNRSKNNLCDGVDLNRNFGFEWEAEGSSSTNPCAETYRGSSAFSEPESQAIANFLNRIKSTLTSYLTFHSYGQYILYPWAYIQAIPKDYRQMRDVGNECAKSAKEIAGKIYRVAPAHILGVAGGGSDDWAKASFNLDYVYTIELRDKGEHGFVLPTDQIYETCREALKMVKTLAKFVSNPRKRIRKHIN